MKNSRPPLSIAVLDLGCLLFAAWTVVCNAVVLARGTPVHLTVAAVAFVAVCCAIGIVGAGRRRLGTWLGLLSDPASPTPEPEDTRQPWPLVRIVTFGAAATIALWFDRHQDVYTLALLALAYFGLSYVAVAGSGRGTPASPEPRAYEWLLWLAALGGAGLTLVLHRPDSDDAFYVNMAVSVVDFPHESLLSRDTLHGIDAPFKIAAYRATSLELLAGVVSRMSHLRVLDVCHLVLPGLAGLLTPLALARLFRLLDPRRWPYATLATLLFLIYDGGSHGSYGNFSFVRLFQGKAMFVTMVAPLIMAHGVRFGLYPSKRTFAMLAAAQIAALGTTVTAFWAAPAIAGLAVLSATPPRLSGLKTLLLGALAPAYLVALGVYFKLQEGGGAAIRALGTSADPPQARTDLVTKAYGMVLGHQLELVAGIAVALLTWPLCRTALGRRFAVVFPLGFFAVLGNPWLASRVSSITTSGIYWRVVWLLPVPILFGLLSSAVLQPGRRYQQLFAVPLFALVLYGYFDRVSPRTIFARTAIAWPHPKVDLHAYRIAQELVRHAPPHVRVVAPLSVSRVLPMLSGYGYPLFVKPTYLPSDPADRKWREQLTQTVSRRRPHGVDESWLIEGLDHYHVEGAVVPQDSHGRHSFAHALIVAHFHHRGDVEGQEIWTRTLPAASH